MQPKLDISDDGFFSLMADDGETKDDVKVPDGEVGEKVEKLFRTDEKDTSKQTLHSSLKQLLISCRRYCPYIYGRRGGH